MGQSDPDAVARSERVGLRVQSRRRTAGRARERSGRQPIINLWSAHLAVDSGGKRAPEIAALHGCASQWPEGRLIAGDFNMQATSSEYDVAAR